MTVVVKRAYDQPDPADGVRVLVDGLWPRGVRKDELAVEAWLKDVAPSPELRRWYGHDPDRFAEFAERYRRELRDPVRAGALERLRQYAAGGPPLTLVTATRDLDHAHTAVLVGLIGSG